MSRHLGIGIISAGKVGAVLGAALKVAGHTIVGSYASSEESYERLDAMLPGVPALAVEEIVERAECVILAVPDDELEPLVSGLAALGAWQMGQLVIHTSGAHGTDVLGPAVAVGALGLAVHPAMTFTGTSLDLQRLYGCPFAVTGPAMIQPIGQALVAEMGGVAVVVDNDKRTLYHAALTHGANHAVTLIAQAMRLLEEAGIEDPGAYLEPLVRASTEGALRSGETLLTGPVVRGDVGTVRRHMAELERTDPQAARTYAQLAGLTAERAVTRRAIPQSVGEAIAEALTAE